MQHPRGSSPAASDAPDDLTALATWLTPAVEDQADVVTVYVYQSVAQVGSVIDLLIAPARRAAAGGR